MQNYLTQNSKAYFTPSVDQKIINHGMIILGEWRQEGESLIPLQKKPIRHNTQEPKSIRDAFKDFYNREGSIPFQECMALRTTK